MVRLSTIGLYDQKLLHFCAFYILADLILFVETFNKVELVCIAYIAGLAVQLFNRVLIRKFYGENIIAGMLGVIVFILVHGVN